MVNFQYRCLTVPGVMRSGLRLVALGLLCLALGMGLMAGAAFAAGSKGSSSAAEGFPLTITDDLGRKVSLEKPPARIISLAPSNTEILFAIGLNNRVVGVTTYCNYPPEATQKEKIGGFSTPNLEKVVELGPDLILATDAHGQFLPEFERLKIPVVVLNPKTVAEVIDSIRLVGKVTGAGEAAERLALELKGRVRAVTNRVKGIPQQQRLKVYYELWHEPLMTAGPGSFIDDLIRLAGGINIASDAEGAYPLYSLERLLEKNPDVMIHSYGHGNSNIPSSEDIKKRKGWQEMAFMKTGRIYLIDADILTRAGPRLVDGLEFLARHLYPELFE